MKHSDIYNPEMDSFLEAIEKEREYYIWEEQEYAENKLYYEYHLEYLDELPTKEKIIKRIA